MPNKTALLPLAALLIGVALPAAAHAASVDLTKLQAMGQAISRNENSMTTPALNEMIVKDQHNYTLIDVRSPQDYEVGHIKGAANVPLTKLFSGDEIGKLSRAPTVVLYSNKTTAAAQAAILLRMTDVKAVALIGGYEGWVEQTLHPKATPGSKAEGAAKRAALIRALNNCPTLPEASIPPLLPAATVAPPAAAAPTAPTVAPITPAPAPAAPSKAPSSSPPIILNGACG
jgi:rhodanese-related sulfurtransferase